MKVYISVDMDGCAAINDWGDILHDKPDFEKTRRFMTAEANAAIQKHARVVTKKMLVGSISPIPRKAIAIISCIQRNQFLFVPMIST